MRAGCRAAVLALCVSLAGCGPVAASSPSPAPAPVAPPGYFLYVPPTAPADAPARVLLALHGVGSSGPEFGQRFAALARQHGWLLVAPSFAYGDWHDPVAVRTEDVELTRQLAGVLDDVAGRWGRPVSDRALVVGFSRGAQLGDRLALFSPQRVAAVASLSAGTYTLPEGSVQLDDEGPADQLPLPYGTADMAAWVGHPLDTASFRRVSFLIGVGEADNDPSDLPRQWDPLLGSTRVARAYTFERTLEQLDVPAQFALFPGASHQLTDAMAARVDAFLSGVPA